MATLEFSGIIQLPSAVHDFIDIAVMEPVGDLLLQTNCRMTYLTDVERNLGVILFHLVVQY
jgi:hypothetical protein